MDFDRTNSNYVEQKIDERDTKLQIGKVSKVYEHTKADDNSNFEVNVILRDENKERRRVPIKTSRKGEIVVPKKGDMVIVAFFQGSGEAPVIIGNFYNAEERPPLGKAGMWRFNRGSLYMEMEPDGNWLRVAKKANDDDDSPSSVKKKVEIDDTPSGGEKINVKLGSAEIVFDGTVTNPTITLKTGDGNVNVETGTNGTINVTAGSSADINIDAGNDTIVNASGKVILGGTSGSPVAREGDPVEDSSGSQIGTIASGSTNVDSA